MKVTRNHTWSINKDGTAYTVTLDDIAQLLWTMVVDKRFRVSADNGVVENLYVSVEDGVLQVRCLGRRIQATAHNAARRARRPLKAKD